MAPAAPLLARYRANVILKGDHRWLLFQRYRATAGARHGRPPRAPGCAWTASRLPSCWLPTPCLSWLLHHTAHHQQPASLSDVLKDNTIASRPWVTQHMPASQIVTFILPKKRCKVCTAPSIPITRGPLRAACISRIYTDLVHAKQGKTSLPAPQMPDAGSLRWPE